MKSLTCRDLGGPCDTVITGNTFEEMAENCKKFVMEQVQAGSVPHIEAVEKMKSLSPEEQQAMYAEFKRKFDEAPEIDKV